MDGGATGDELAALDRALAAAEIADEAARLAHQQHAGGNVPDVEVGLPETVQSARCPPSDVQAPGADTADAGDLRTHVRADPSHPPPHTMATPGHAAPHHT